MWANPSNMPKGVTIFLTFLFLTVVGVLITFKLWVGLVFLSILLVIIGYVWFSEGDNLCPYLHNHHDTEWGGYRNVADSPSHLEGTKYKVKMLVVEEGQSTSLQSHEHRKEVWVIANGVATVTYGDKEFILKEGDTIKILEGYKHRITNNGDEMLVVVDVWYGNHLDENDITRYDEE